MIELRHLRYFQVLAQELNFTTAAHRLNIVQPALSQNIRQLEEELGIRLLERNNRRVALTAAGRVFERETRATMGHLAKSCTAARRVAAGETGRLAFGFVDSALVGNSARALRRFHHLYPDVQLELRDDPVDTLLERLRRGELDLACANAEVREEGIASLELQRFPLFCAMHPDNPLASRRSLHLKDLAGEMFIMPSPDVLHSYQDRLLDVCQAAGLELARGYYTHSLTAGYSMVGCNVAVMICHQIPNLAPPQGVIFRRLRDPHLELSLPLMLLWRKGELSPTAENFLSIVRQIVGKERVPRAVAASKKKARQAAGSQSI